MSITIKTKDVGDVKDVRGYGDVAWTLDDRINMWIKNNLGINDE